MNCRCRWNEILTSVSIYDAVPIQWHAANNRIPSRILMTAAMLVNTYRLMFLLMSESHFAFCVALLCSNLAVYAMGFLVTFVKRSAYVECASVLITVLFSYVVTHVTMLGVDVCAMRVKWLAFSRFLTKLVPLVLGMPLRWAIPFLACTAFIDSAGHAAVARDCPELFGGKYPYVVICLAFLVFCVSTYWTQRRLCNLYESQQDLDAEKCAFENLLSMVCDAMLWVNKAGDVVRCDDRFDMLVGRPMAGKALMTFVPEQEQQRLLNALTHAHHMPNLPPTTLLSQDDNKALINVDCFIVQRSSSRINNSMRNADAMLFLLGVRTTGQPMIIVKDDCTAGESTLEALGKLEVMRKFHQSDDEMSALHGSVPETTSTGLAFKDRSGDLGQIISIGTREGWLVEDDSLELDCDAVLGEGAFGVVVSASLRGTSAALKITKGSDVKSLLIAANELRILRHLRHPNIVMFFGANVNRTSPHIGLVMEQIAGVSLAKFLPSLGSNDQVHIRCKLILDIACALWYLHAQRPPVVHGDLKDKNVFVENHGFRAKLLDFGLARVLTRHAKPLGGTLSWMAPEIMLSSHVWPKPTADVFSFGRLVYTILSGQRPLNNLKREDVLRTAQLGQTMPLLWPDRMPLREECIQMCESSCAYDPGLRPGIQRIHAVVSSWLPVDKAEPKLTTPNLDFDKFQHDLTPWPKGSTRSTRKSSGCKDFAVPPCGAVERLSMEKAHLILPQREPTKQGTKVQMLCTTAMQWNFPFKAGYCCPYHAALVDMESIVAKMYSLQCLGDFFPHSDWQCAECGALNDTNICEVCNEIVQWSDMSLSTIQHEFNRQPNKASIQL